LASCNASFRDAAESAARTGDVAVKTAATASNENHLIVHAPHCKTLKRLRCSASGIGGPAGWRTTPAFSAAYEPNEQRADELLAQAKTAFQREGDADFGDKVARVLGQSGRKARSATVRGHADGTRGLAGSL
jgi:hypothetical protein